MSTKSIILVLVLFFVVLAAILFFTVGSPGQNQDNKIYRIGLLQMASTVNANMDGFKAGMEELGYIKDKNVIYHYENANGNTELLKEYTKKFIEEKVDLIFTNTSPATQTAKEMTSTTTIPVIFSMVADPVRAGFVANIQSSGNNLSGTSCAYIDIAPKRLEFLKDAFPGIKKVLVFYRAGDKSGQPAAEALEQAGKKLGIEIIKKEVIRSDEVKAALKNLKPGEVDALMDPADSMVTANVDSLVEASLRLRIPLMMMSDMEAEKGALVTYGVDYFDLGKQSASLAAKVLQGTKPSEIPIEMPRIFRTVINLKTAAQIGVTVPEDVISRADRIIK